MSSVSVAEIVEYGIIYMAIGGVGAISKFNAWLRGKDQETPSALDELKKAEEVVKKKLLDEVAAELGRVCGSGREGLRGELEELKSSLEGQSGGEAEMDAAVEKLNALRLKVRGTELDEAQSRARAGFARHLFDALRALDIAPWEKELNRLEGEFEKILRLPIEERLFELQCLIDRLREMEKLSATAANVNLDALEERRYVPEEESRLRVIREIRDWADRIAQTDEAEGEKIRPMLENLRANTPFPDRLDRLRGQTKATWGALRERAASTEFFREKLADLLALLQASKSAADSPEGSALIRRCDTLRGGKFIDREFFMTLYEDVSRFVWSRGEEIADSFFAQKVGQALAELGYELLSDEAGASTEAGVHISEPVLSPGRVRLLESPYEGYRVMLKVDARGVVTTRLVRVTGSEALAVDQKQKDIEAGKKWCRDFDEFLEKMRDQALPLYVTLRKEPEEVELMTVADEKGRKKKCSWSEAKPKENTAR